MSADAARARGRLWVTTYVEHYHRTYPDALELEPWAIIEAARDLITDALDYVDALTLEHHLPTDGSSQVLEDITRARSSLTD